MSRLHKAMLHFSQICRTSALRKSPMPLAFLGRRWEVLPSGRPRPHHPSVQPASIRPGQGRGAQSSRRTRTGAPRQKLRRASRVSRILVGQKEQSQCMRFLVFFEIERRCVRPRNPKAICLYWGSTHMFAAEDARISSRCRSNVAPVLFTMRQASLDLACYRLTPAFRSCVAFICGLSS